MLSRCLFSARIALAASAFSASLKRGQHRLPYKIDDVRMTPMYDTGPHRKDTRGRVLRFTVTGIFVTGIHAASAIALMHLFTLSPPAANGSAFIIATIISYLINAKWSFSAQLHGRTFARFCVVAILGFLSATLVAWIVQILGFHHLIGIAAVVTIVPLITFILHNFWTFR